MNNLEEIERFKNYVQALLNDLSIPADARHIFLDFLKNNKEQFANGLPFPTITPGLDRINIAWRCTSPALFFEIEFYISQGVAIAEWFYAIDDGLGGQRRTKSGFYTIYSLPQTRDIRSILDQIVKRNTNGHS